LDTKTENQKPAWIKWVVYLAILAGVIVLYKSLPIDTWVTNFRVWVQDQGPLGWFICIATYAIAAFLLIPGSILTLTMGLAYGLWGFIIVVVGASIGAGMSFLASRYLLSDYIHNKFGDKPIFRALNEAIKEEGWKVVGLMRFSPAVPFSLQNWLFGVTKVGFVPYILSTFFGIMPGSLLYVWIGSIGGTAASGADTSVAKYALLIVGIIATLLVTIIIGKKAKAKLQVHGLDE